MSEIQRLLHGSSFPFHTILRFRILWLMVETNEGERAVGVCDRLFFAPAVCRTYESVPGRIRRRLLRPVRR